MNRRGWLKALCGALVGGAALGAKPISDSKLGYVAVGVCDETGKYLFSPEDIIVYVNGERWIDPDKPIQRASDIEGWIEYIDTKNKDRLWWRTVHVKADVRLERVSCPHARQWEVKTPDEGLGIEERVRTIVKQQITDQARSGGVLCQRT